MHTLFAGDEARNAIAEGNRLSILVGNAESLSGKELEDAIGSMKQELETAVIPVAQKSDLKARLAVLTKKLLEMQKAMAADNKKKVIGLALEAADEVIIPNSPLGVFKCSIVKECQCQSLVSLMCSHMFILRPMERMQHSLFSGLI